MRSIICAALSVGIAVGGASSAFAQDTDNPYYEYNYREPYNDEDKPEVPIRPSNCGEFRYWNGEKCVDARLVPPDIR